MAVVTYLGGAKDHVITPQVLGIGENGKPDKRAPMKERSKIKFTEMGEFKLWGETFAKGEQVVVTNKKLVDKIKALGCFDVRENLEQKKKT